MDLAKRQAVIAMLWLAGCSGVPTARTGPASTPKPTAAPAASIASVAVAGTSTTAQPPEAVDEAAEYPWDELAGTLDGKSPHAPCDFSRPYRGKVGNGGYSVVLSRRSARLSGFAAYDAGYGDLALAGGVAADGKLTLTESKGGQPVGALTGVCDPATGAISGRWSGGGESKALVLEPRPAGGVGLVERLRQFGEFREDVPSCSWTVRSPAVFGLGAPGRTGRINATLQVSFGKAYEPEMVREVKRCEPGARKTVAGWYSVEVNSRGLLSVLLNGYVYFGPAAHGEFNAAAAAVSIDVATGRKLALGDVITSSKALRPVVRSCMKLVVEAVDGGDAWWWERAIQGVPADEHGQPVDEGSPEFVPSSVREPSFLVLPHGLAVLIRGQPTVSSGLELQGPVLRWGALRRAGVLEPRSPVARLWVDAPALGPAEPTCVEFFQPRWAKPTVR